MRYALAVYAAAALCLSTFAQANPLHAVRRAVRDADKSKGTADAAPAAAAAANLTKEDAHNLALDAYNYFFPMVLTDVTRAVLTNSNGSTLPGLGPPNRFVHLRTFPAAEFKRVVRPNYDTIYSSAWVHLTEPYVCAWPDFGDRYFLLPIYDMFSDVQHSPGSRTTGQGAGKVVLIPPGWTGDLPEELKDHTVNCSTTMAWLIPRIYTSGTKEDYDAVHKLQDQLKAIPLSKYVEVGMDYVPEPVTNFVPNPTIEMRIPPPRQLANMTAEQFFTYAMKLSTAHPHHVMDYPIIQRMRRIGLHYGKPFAGLNANGDVVADALTSVMNSSEVNVLKRTLSYHEAPFAAGSKCWYYRRDQLGSFGTNYRLRAAIGVFLHATNVIEDAIYPAAHDDSTGNPLEGKFKYTITFPKGRMPPGKGFWSLTLYDADGYTLPNPLNKYSIGGRDPLKENVDGSTTIYVQKESPGTEKKSNWLPAPTDAPFNLMLRIYWAKLDVFTGTWVPPEIIRVDDKGAEKKSSS
eukprot:comp20175_c0_seq1/m.25009 comp20175_c0_seq1/g.25009  ORF comp20175_c0_seq1/g.25009 comp20175_c0_seq1/m.25009 type:complete len:518 (-) comp20175_c0_seq1:360-1913(-)